MIWHYYFMYLWILDTSFILFTIFYILMASDLIHILSFDFGPSKMKCMNLFDRIELELLFTRVYLEHSTCCRFLANCRNFVFLKKNVISRLSIKILINTRFMHFHIQSYFFHIRCCLMYLILAIIPFFFLPLAWNIKVSEFLSFVILR